MSDRSPFGQSAADASRRGARRSAAYRAEQARLAPYEEVARIIIRLRMDNDLTQEALAKRVGPAKRQSLASKAAVARPLPRYCGRSRAPSAATW